MPLLTHESKEAIIIGRKTLNFLKVQKLCFLCLLWVLSLSELFNILGGSKPKIYPMFFLKDFVESIYLISLIAEPKTGIKINLCNCQI